MAAINVRRSGCARQLPFVGRAAPDDGGRHSLPYNVRVELLGSLPTANAPSGARLLLMFVGRAAPDDCGRQSLPYNIRVELLGSLSSANAPSGARPLCGRLLY
ncbi:MAG: hypothetical protein WBM63_20065, partial [Sedimenticolaceae bacterium]